jgi:hypothetical protein
MTSTETDRPRCSIGARERGDSQIATAAPAQGYLLIEQPGSWGIHALRESALDAAVMHRLAEKASKRHLRILLIRRPGRRPASPRRSWFVVDSRPGSERIRSGQFENDRELLHLDFDKDGVEHSQPLYLVCTHGRHDTCCAVEGRPVAVALAAGRPDQTWECSHLGGDRFAANLLVLPAGLTYGYVDPVSALAVVDAYEHGVVEPHLLRGRGVFSPPVQAAQHFARAHTGELAVAGVEPLVVEQRDDGWAVDIATASGVLAIIVRAVADPPAAALTCRADHLGLSRHFELVDLQER